jgi:hypothetical protein
MKSKSKKKNKESCCGSEGETKNIKKNCKEKRFKMKLRWVPVLEESDLPSDYTYYLVTTEDEKGRLKTEIAEFCWSSYNGELSYNWKLKEYTVSWHNDSNNEVEVTAWADWNLPRPYGSRKL